ncbi:MAG: sigma 54-interacting transcriptional regulator [Candidatus Magnetoovum sp. WYHC-5]|nr:sigma 54-interacting transcriptional regulator [Candidatus Magnetoovum sp. WYHC-5]
MDNNITQEKGLLPLRELSSQDICLHPLSKRFTIQVQRMISRNETIFPNIYGLEHPKRRLIEILMAGHGVLLKGDFGVGKTHMANAIFSIIKQYYIETPVYTNIGCPVRENAYYLYRYLIENDKDAINHICPVCKHKYISTQVDVNSLMVERVYLYEGGGFARIQGNEDIEPERILGMYHLTRYAEIGDPFDPRVLEPGKIAQGSAGVLFVDELGLLNKEAQYAFIQSLQEKHFTPTNSRMTFPIDFLFVSTTNTINEFQIHKAVQNRLVGLRIDRVIYHEEVQIAKDKLKTTGFDVTFPNLLLEYIVETIRKLNNSTVYLGVRSSIRAAQLAAASAVLEVRSVVDYCDVREGLYAEVLGQTDDDNYEECLEMLSKDFINISDFLTTKLPDIENAGMIASSYVDIDSAIADMDSTIIENIFKDLAQEEKTMQMLKLYLEAYITGCNQKNH